MATEWAGSCSACFVRMPPPQSKAEASVFHSAENDFRQLRGLGQERRVTRIQLDDLRGPRSKHLALRAGRYRHVVGTDDVCRSDGLPRGSRHGLLEGGV